MYKIVIELPSKESEINHIQRPEGVEITITNDEFLNASGLISEIIIRFIFEAIAGSVLNKVGEDVYEYLKKIILKNNESKNKSELKFQIESKDFIVNFSGNNLNNKSTEIALKEFGNILDKIPEYSTGDEILVFNENSNKWELGDSIKSNWIDDLRNNAMENFNDQPMKTLAELNASIDGAIYLPNNLPLHEYILMPNIGSTDFENFREKYIQNNGKNLGLFEDKLESNPIYAVFKNENNNPPFLFEPINEINKIK